jgi:hypothetical protein
MLAWNAIRLELGGTYLSSTLSMEISPGTISQVIPVDPDGAGPLLAQSATLSVTPTINAGILTSLWGAYLGATTGWTAFHALSFCVGGGITCAQTDSAISVSVDHAEIEVAGYLSNLITENGSISISGTISDYAYFLWGGYLSAGLGFSSGPFSLSIPLIWKIPGGLGAGAFVGIAL